MPQPCRRVRRAAARAPFRPGSMPGREGTGRARRGRHTRPRPPNGAAPRTRRGSSRDARRGRRTKSGQGAGTPTGPRMPCPTLCCASPIPRRSPPRPARQQHERHLPARGTEGFKVDRLHTELSMTRYVAIGGRRSRYAPVPLSPGAAAAPAAAFRRRFGKACSRIPPSRMPARATPARPKPDRTTPDATKPQTGKLQRPKQRRKAAKQPIKAADRAEPDKSTA